MLRKLLITTLVVIILTSSLSQRIYVNATDAYLDTDKDEISLGEELTIRVAEPDANLDSRSIDRIPLNQVLITTNKFDETSLDKVLAITGIRASQSSLRETGFNTGVFEVTLENINSKLVNRGSQIKIIYLDNTPSGGGSPVRIQKVVQVVEAKIAIAIVFDRKEYSPFDQVEVKLIAQMYNVNRNKIDTLNTPTGNRVTVTTASGQTFYPPMFETGVNTGVFVGKVQLTSDQHEKSGDLVVTSGDRISVSVVIVPGFTVSDFATITTTMGGIAFDKSEYSIGDTMKVIVTDPDENRDPNVMDTLEVCIWSNTDIEGIKLLLGEQGNSSGVFEGMLILSSESSTDKNLRVSDSDVLVVLYKDLTVPSLTKTLETKGLFATARIGSATGMMVSNPLVLDQNDRSVSSVKVGNDTTIKASVTNARATKEPFVYAIHIKDDGGFTSQLSFVTGTLEAYQSIGIGHNWTPDAKGKYTIEVLLWSSLTEPSVLSPVKKTVIVAD